MRVSKGLILVCFLVFSGSSCFDPPVFNNRPEIKFVKIQFKETPLLGENDSLILYLDFKDGDGDLGLGHVGENLDPEVESQYASDPFHSSNFYLTNGTGDTLRMATRVAFLENATKSYNFLIVPDGVTGKLATDRSRLLPNYGFLPINDGSNKYYKSPAIEVLVKESDNVVDGTYNIVDTIADASGRHFVVKESFLYKLNPFHNNIDVKFMVFENGEFVEYEWIDEDVNFNGRFPILSNEPGSPVEGTIKYTMENTSFIGAFGSRDLKLRIRIRDRALNTSREIDTKVFDLREIQVD